MKTIITWLCISVMIFVSSGFPVRVSASEFAPTIVSSSSGIIVSETSEGDAVSTVPLIAGTTKTLYVYGIADDQDGCTEIDDVSNYTIKIVRSSLDAYSCSDDPNNCYTVQSGNITLGNTNVCEESDTNISFEGTAEIQYYADPTVVTNDEEEWRAYVVITDDILLTSTEYTEYDSFEISELAALSLPESVHYDSAIGDLALGEYSLNKELVITNHGNVAIDADVVTTDMTCDGNGIITASRIAYKLGSEIVDSVEWGTLDSLHATLDHANDFELNIAKQTDTDTPITGSLNLMLSIPDVGIRGTCTGLITLVAKKQGT